MAEQYTHGVWTVKPGREDEFVAAWREFAEWSKREVPGALWVRLLRDSATPNRFVSVGPWASPEAVARWRAEPGWKERIGRIREMLDGFEASSLEAVVALD
jgi:heme-degrading monooxygenase HmoA